MTKKEEPAKKRLVDIDDLVGVREIAKRFGVNWLSIVHSWMTRDPTFPKPLKTLSEDSKKPYRVFSMRQVEEWHARRSA